MSLLFIRLWRYLIFKFLCIFLLFLPTYGFSIIESNQFLFCEKNRIIKKNNLFSLCDFLSKEQYPFLSIRPLHSNKIKTRASIAPFISSGNIFGLMSSTAIITTASVAAGVIGIAALTSSSSTEDTSKKNSVLLPTTTDYYRNNEYLKNEVQFDLIHLDQALASTANIVNSDFLQQAQHAGSGIIVAVLDTGIDSTHSDLVHNFIPNCTGFCSLFDPIGHGTGVAGIIAAQKNESELYGVAYNATLLPGCVDLDGGNCTPVSSGIGALIHWAVNNDANIANLSFGYGFTEPASMLDNRALVVSDIITTPINYNDDQLKLWTLGLPSSSSYQNLQTALSKGIISVKTAGNYQYITQSVPNEKIQQPAIDSLLPLIYEQTTLKSALRDQWLVVVSVDENGSLSSFSHACGDAMLFCLAAPGENIYTTLPNDSYYQASGTSFAAPMVSGGIALIMSAFPTIQLPSSHPDSELCERTSAAYNNKQCRSKAVVNRILTTATDLGVSGTDAVFGNGLLNLASASDFIGTPHITSITGILYPLSKNTLNLSAFYGDNIVNQLQSKIFIASDSYDQAGIAVSASQLINSVSSIDQPTINLHQYIQKSLGYQQPYNMIHQGNLTWKQRLRKADSYNDDFHYQHRLQYKTNHFGTFEWTNSFDPIIDFSPLNAMISSRLAIRFSQAFISPYAAFNMKSKGIKHHIYFTNGFQLSSAFFKSKQTAIQGQNQIPNATYSMHVKINTPQYQLAHHTISSSIQLGALKEEEAILGSGGKGIWAVQNGSRSFSIGTSLQYQWYTDFSLLAHYFYSITQAAMRTTMIEQSQLYSSSFSLGALGKINNDQLQYGFFISQPLSITSGKAQLTLPTGFNQHQLAYSHISVDLAPKTRHLEYELSLRWQPHWANYSQINLIRLENYNNISNNNDNLILLTIGYQF